MSRAVALSDGTAAPFPTHILGGGPDDQRYVVQRFQALADGDIRPIPAEQLATKGRKIQRTVATLKAVREMRLARNEVIACTGLKTRDGAKYRGSLAIGLGIDCNQRG